MLVFGEREKPEYAKKNLSEQSRKPTNSTHMWRRRRKSNPGHINSWKASAGLSTLLWFIPALLNLRNGKQEF